MSAYYLGKAEYQVQVPLVVARLLNGSDVYLYQGDIVPTDVHPQTIDRLVSDGAITKLEAVA